MEEETTGLEAEQRLGDNQPTNQPERMRAGKQHKESKLSKKELSAISPRHCEVGKACMCPSINTAHAQEMKVSKTSRALKKTTNCTMLIFSIPTLKAMSQ